MNAQYLSQSIPEPQVVLGLRLRPFCLGHELILSRFLCAFLDPDGQPDHGDLLLGVLVCAQTYEAALEDVFNPHIERSIRRLERDNTGFLGRRIIPWHEEFARFRMYLDDARQCPNIIGEPATKTLNIPLIQAVKVTLMRMGNTESEALNKPYGLALWDYFTCRAMDSGKVDFVGDNFRNDYDEAQEMADKFDLMVKGGAYGEV